MRLKLYLAGPMRGYPQFNFPAFEYAAKVLRDAGYEIISPAEKDLMVPGFDPSNPETAAKLDLAETMRWDLRTVLDCDGIVLLAGWERSQGARLERLVAESTGRRVYLFFPKNNSLIPATAWDHPDVFAAGRRGF